MINNLVKEVSNNPGTGTTVQLAGAPSGFASFVAGFGSGGKCFYFLTDGVQTEAQNGVVTAGAPNTLSRGTPLWTSTGSLSRLNFTGSVTVYSALPAQRAPHFDDTNALQMLSRKMVALANGDAAQDAAAIGQLGWRNLSTQFISSPVAGVTFTLPDPSIYTFLRLDWRDMVPAAAAQLYMRYSTDGGATFKSGASDYSFVATASRAASVTPSGAASTFIGLSEAIQPTGSCMGHTEFAQFGGMGHARSVGIITGPAISRWDIGFNPGFAGPLTHVFLAYVGVNIAGGTVRLMGAS